MYNNLQLDDTPKCVIKFIKPGGAFCKDQVVVERYEGPSQSRLKHLHEMEMYDAMCSFCYEDACKFMIEHNL